MIILLKALNADGEKLLNKLVSDWADRQNNKSFLRNMMSDKVLFTVEQQEPIIVRYEQPRFADLRNNNKTRRVMAAMIYSQFKSNGVNETNVEVMFE